MTPQLAWMLWYEEIQTNGFVQALQRASEFYKTKYGCWPNRVQAPLAWKLDADALRTRLAANGKTGIGMEVQPDNLKRHIKVVFDPDIKRSNSHV
ncbi:MAG: hypothetical protein H8D34_18265 [Chloroflexi bacterium]|nr:hypothetical protein [Chloroflexota bacterium]